MSSLLDGKRMRFSQRSTCELHAKISGELPEELIGDEILTRLPIKSVVRFKSVCKSWLSLFSDPQFVRQHENLQNPDDKDCLVVDKSNHIVILSRYQEKYVLNNDHYCLIGCAKGLVCMRRKNVLSLWNPAIHQSKEFHLPPLASYDCLIRAGLGFDPVSNDYRVGICYRDLVDKSRLCYAVYSAHSDSWIHHQFQFHDPDYAIRISKFDSSHTPTTMVRDCPYWTTYSTTLSSSNKDKVILSLTALKFDATSNKFKLLPDFSSYFSMDKTFQVINMSNLLSFMAYEQCPVGKLEVYSLDEDNGCGWSKMYSFGPFEEFWRFEYLQQGFKYGDEIVFKQYGTLYRFNHKVGTFECIPGVKTVTMCGCFTYTPSVVSLPGMTSIYSENQSTPSHHHHSSRTPLRLMSSLRNHLPFKMAIQVFE